MVRATVVLAVRVMGLPLPTVRATRAFPCFLGGVRFLSALTIVSRRCPTFSRGAGRCNGDVGQHAADVGVLELADEAGAQVTGAVVDEQRGDGAVPFAREQLGELVGIVRASPRSASGSAPAGAGRPARARRAWDRRATPTGRWRRGPAPGGRGNRCRAALPCRARTSWPTGERTGRRPWPCASPGAGWSASSRVSPSAGSLAPSPRAAWAGRRRPSGWRRSVPSSAP